VRGKCLLAARRRPPLDVELTNDKVAGFTLGGVLGALIAMHGLATRNLLGVELVLSTQSTVLTRTACLPQLFRYLDDENLDWKQPGIRVTDGPNIMAKEDQNNGKNLFVAFDFDGTIADTYAIFRQAFNDAAQAMGVQSYRVEDEPHIRSLEAVDVFRLHGIEPPAFAPFVQLLRNGMELRRAQAKMFDGIPEVLNTLLREGIHLGLISSNSRTLVASILGRHFSNFEFQVFDVSLADKVVALKETALRYASAAVMCYVGDEIRDAKAAQAANIPFVSVTWGYNTGTSLRRAGCDMCIDKPGKLGEFLINWQRDLHTRHPEND
jgi:phosphoglycolate phosphatase